jgi:PAS domain S-box-containing protein
LIDLKSITEEQRFQLLVNAVVDYAIYMLDTEGRVATWNPGAERFKGYTADEIIGEHFSRFYTAEDRDADVPGRALRIAAREGRFEAEGWRVRKDGTQFWAHAVLDPIRAPDGTLIGFAKITRDITSKRDQEKALYDSEQRFRMLIQGVRDYAIYMLDPDGRVTNWNSGAQLIKGYTEREIVGEHFSRFYTEDDRAAGEPARALETALREGKYEREAWRVRKDGSLFWASVVIDPIYGENGEHIGFAKITRDATEKKKAQDELDEARHVLAQSQKLQALGELTGGIAHDFNNLMTVIAGSTDFLLRRPDLSKDKRRQYLEAVSETANRAAALTSQLLAFGRRQSIKPEVIDANARLESFAKVLSRTLGSKIDVALELAPSLGHIEVDSAQLETALLNAAFNARDAMSGSGRLVFSTAEIQEADQRWVRIAITDTGMGMPQRIVERAFEPFFTTKEVGKGTGLGLSQIHGFAAQAGGRAEIRSKEGQGTTISIILPRSDKELALTPDHMVISTLPGGLTVLLVEDNAQVRQFAESLLDDLGCEVISAASGEEALRLLESRPVDLVFSDVVMPGMSGVDLARRVGEMHAGVPVLLATGYSDEIVKSRPEFAVLPKPYRPQDLTEAIAALLKKHGELAAFRSGAETATKECAEN